MYSQNDECSGVYLILNTIDGKVYVGSSKDLRERRVQHFYQLRRGVHSNDHLQSAWNKYGEECFEFIVLAECSLEKRVELEREWMEWFNSLDSDYGYNVRDAEMKTMKEETKRKISQSMLGVNTWTKGKRRSQVVRSQISASLKGIKRSEASKRRYRNSKMGENNPSSKLSDEQRKQVCLEYEPRKVGYGFLAKKYGISRSGVQGLIRRSRI